MASGCRREVLIENIATEVTIDVRKLLILRRPSRQPGLSVGVIPGTGMVRRWLEDEHDCV
jgi:hypothetical protein